MLLWLRVHWKLFHRNWNWKPPGEIFKLIPALISKFNVPNSNSKLIRWYLKVQKNFQTQLYYLKHSLFNKCCYILIFSKKKVLVYFYMWDYSDIFFKNSTRYTSLHCKYCCYRWIHLSLTKFDILFRPFT